MKHITNPLTLFFLTFALVLAAVSAQPLFARAATKTVEVTGKYYQSDARKMRKMINAFRTGDDAWYYKEEGSKKKVTVTGLSKLKYDYKLEKIAMKRAAEISILFEHTRPNGKSCFSLYPDEYMAMGENIAYGTSSIMSTKDAFVLWQETDKSYNGQGHRRNMLSENYTSVGIACFEVNGCKYWVQEFGSPSSNLSKTTAVNKTKTVKIKVKK